MGWRPQADVGVPKLSSTAPSDVASWPDDQDFASVRYNCAVTFRGHTLQEDKDSLFIGLCDPSLLYGRSKAVEVVRTGSILQFLGEVRPGSRL